MMNEFLNSLFQASISLVISQYLVYTYIETVSCKTPDEQAVVEPAVVEPVIERFSKLGINHTDIDLSNYYIYTKEQLQNNIHIKENGLIKSLNRKLGARLTITDLFDEAKYIKFYNETGLIHKKSLHSICDILKIQIKLYEVDKNNEVQSYTYGKNNYLTVIKLALYKEHYFLYEDIQVSKAYINNYKEIQELIKSKPNLKHIPNRYKFLKFSKTRTSFEINESITTNNLVIIKAMMKYGLIEYPS